MDDMIIKKVNYAIIQFTVEGERKLFTVYGKSKITNFIKDIVEEYGLISFADIDIKMITERRSISLENFLKYSIVLEE